MGETTKDQRQLVGLDEAAEMCGVGLRTFERHVLGPGHVRSVKIGGRRLIEVESLTEYVRSLTV
jgi:excisionase family DNA binding protein